MAGENRQVPDLADPKYVELVQAVIDKTREGKIVWRKSSASLSASVPPDISIAFILATTAIRLFPSSEGWNSFVILRGKTELLRVEALSSNPLIVILRGDDPLRKAADELYSLVAQIAKDELDKTIDAINRI